MNNEYTRQLVVGNPIRLHWPLAGSGGDPLPGEAGLRQFCDEISRRVASLDEADCLHAFARYREENNLLVDSIDLGILVHDRHRRIARFNRAAEGITGLARGEVLGRDCHDLFPPGGFCGPKCSFCHGEMPFGKGENHQYEVLYEHPRTGHRRLKLSVTGIDIGDHKTPGVLVVFRDLTELSDLRQQLNRERTFHGMAGISPAMQDVFQTIQQVAFSDYPVLITGESGTGKELVAEAIHAESPRRKEPFVPVNCAALPESILESELFGHVRGAFTGAIRDKKGRFEMARGGTLFLDEIGELSPGLQVKLLRVLQEKRFERVGGEETHTADVRLISATNRDLTQMVARGEFREDFYYRLRVVPIDLPPLRERTADLPLLVDQILGRIRKETEKRILSVSPEAMRRFREYDWPGNVRELINALQFASISCNEEAIREEHLSAELRGAMEQRQRPRTGAPGTLPGRQVPQRVAAGGEGESRSVKPRRRTRLTPEAVREALDETGNNKARAARLLGVGRATLYRFLKTMAQ
jgi:PAS domain S-box-containing protein